MGAIVAALTLTLAAVTAIRRAKSTYVMPAYAVVVALVLQLTIGITMVLRGFPLALATAHTAGAALLLLSVLALLRGAVATARAGTIW
jgi:cytochrome c oxidase assembly protein subunit 15